MSNNHGHAACADKLGYAFYCGADGDCVEASLCEAEDCCLPGRKGDAYCQAAFGMASLCAAETCVRGDESAGCVSDTAGHAACAKEHGSGHYCDGRECVMASFCREDRCCVPGAKDSRTTASPLSISLLMQ